MARRQQRLAGWQHLFDAASASSREMRQLSLIRGYAWVEHALDAADAPGPPRPIANRVLRTLSMGGLGAGLDERKVRAAISARHRASHQDKVPEVSECSDAVKTFRDIWHALSRQFVNMRTAIELGSDLLKRDNVETVCLYGSLARAQPEPNDIDLLVLDNGAYSSLTSPGKYSEGTFDAVRMTTEALHLLDCERPKLLRCVECKWLDILLIDGVRFGSDLEYTTGIRLLQPDPWFFLNLSRDIKELDPVRGVFMELKRPPFAGLRRVHADLQKLGLA